MTENEAINVLQLNRPFAYSELQNAVDVAIQVLEKQIPKMAIDMPTDDTCMYYERYCPSCNSLLIYKYKYCPKCGQKLNWG